MKKKFRVKTIEELKKLPTFEREEDSGYLVFQGDRLFAVDMRSLAGSVIEVAPYNHFRFDYIGGAGGVIDWIWMKEWLEEIPEVKDVSKFVLQTIQDEIEFLAWIDALLSGEWSQAEEDLQVGESFCCLGVGVCVSDYEGAAKTGNGVLWSGGEGIPSLEAHHRGWLRRITDKTFHGRALTDINDYNYLSFHGIAELLVDSYLAGELCDFEEMERLRKEAYANISFITFEGAK